MAEKKLFAIFHYYDEDDDLCDEYGPGRHYAGLVEATDEEIAKFLEKWSKPEVYYHWYRDFVCHIVKAEEVKAEDPNVFEPYSTDPNEGFNSYIREAKEQAKK